MRDDISITFESQITQYRKFLWCQYCPHKRFLPQGRRPAIRTSSRTFTWVLDDDGDADSGSFEWSRRSVFKQFNNSYSPSFLSKAKVFSLWPTAKMFSCDLWSKKGWILEIYERTMRKYYLVWNSLMFGSWCIYLLSFKLFRSTEVHARWSIMVF